MPFLVTVKARDLGHIFLNLAVSATDRGEAIVFLTLVPLLIQTWYFFFSLQVFWLEVLLLPASEELNGFGIKGGRDFSTGSLQGSRVEEVCDLAIME